MSNIPKRVAKRLKTEGKKYKKILERAQAMDVNESDTVTIIGDMLADVFGFDKYKEITSEFVIKNTFCDLAIKFKNEVVFLIECKAIGVELKEPHVNQALGYAANHGVDWVILTNGQHWRAYKVLFEKPIRLQQIFEIDMISLNLNDESAAEKVFSLSKESIQKNTIKRLHQEMQLMNKFTIAAILQSDTTIKSVVKQLKSFSKGIKIDAELVESIIVNDMLKREVLDSDEAKFAYGKYRKNAHKRKIKQPKAAPLIHPDQTATLVSQNPTTIV